MTTATTPDPRHGWKLLVYILAVAALLAALTSLPGCTPKRPLSKPKFAVRS